MPREPFDFDKRIYQAQGEQLLPIIEGLPFSRVEKDWLIFHINDPQEPIRRQMETLSQHWTSGQEFPEDLKTIFIANIRHKIFGDLFSDPVFSSPGYGVGERFRQYLRGHFEEYREQLMRIYLLIKTGKIEDAVNQIEALKIALREKIGSH